MEGGLAEGMHLLGPRGLWELAGEHGSHLKAPCSPDLPAYPPAGDPNLCKTCLLRGCSSACLCRPGDGNLVEGLF